MSNPPLLSDIEIGAFRDVALQGMQTPIAIYHRTSIQTDDGWKNVMPTTPTSNVLGWIYSTPTAVQSEVSGKIVTINTYRLFVPVGTVITASDEVLAEGTRYIVSDTIASNTWNAMLRVSLRFAE